MICYPNCKSFAEGNTIIKYKGSSSLVTRSPEYLQQIFIRNLLWIILHLHHLGVPRPVGANIAIRRILHRSALVADSCRDNALWQLAKLGLYTPKTSCSKCSLLQTHLYSLFVVFLRLKLQ